MKLTRSLLALAMSGAILMGYGGLAVAATAVANLPVGVTATANCTIATAAVTFAATYDPVGTHATNPDDGTGTVTVTCTKGAGTSINLSLGANANVTQPRMKGPGVADFLNYTLYSDATRTTLWSGAALTIVAAPSKAARAFTVYARIPGGQDISTGTYNDTVVATVNF